MSSRFKYSVDRQFIFRGQTGKKYSERQNILPVKGKKGKEEKKNKDPGIKNKLNYKAPESGYEYDRSLGMISPT